MIRTRLGLVGLLVCLTIAYTVAAYFLPNTLILIIVRSFQVAASGAVVWRYRPGLVKVWRQGFRGNDEEILTFAIVLGYGALGINALWLWLWRGALEPHWMVDAAINGYCVVISAWAGVLYSAAPGADHGELTRGSKRMVTLVLLATFALSILGLTASPMFMRLEAWIKPYMAEHTIEDSDSEFRRQQWRD